MRYRIRMLDFGLNRMLVVIATLGLCSAAHEASGARRFLRTRYIAPPAAAMAIDLYSGRILQSKNANVLRYPASLTKVMTLYLLFDALRDGKLTMKTELRVSAHAAAQSPTKLGLEEGDTITVSDAIGAIVTKSANDMAVAVAEKLAGSEEAFARFMTVKARSIGMVNTTFRNASGLPNPEQQTTAQDLTVLGKSILAAHPERAKVFGTRYFQYDGHVFQNHNTLLFTYEGMEGMKTGYTSAAGFNLIASAHRGDKRILAVVLGGESSGSRNAAMRDMLDNCWAKALTKTAAARTATAIAELKGTPPSAPSPAKAAVAKAAPVRASPPKIVPVYTAPVFNLKSRPDRASSALLYTAMETGLALRRSPPGEARETMTTDEPEDAAVSAQPRDTRGGLIQEVAKAQPVPDRHEDVNVSVYYKTSRPEVARALIAVAEAESHLDGEAQGAPASLVPPEPIPSVIAAAQYKANEPVTLAAAGAAAAQDAEPQPGPFHIQVGAFAEKSIASQRLESVREALGDTALKAHRMFIMPVAISTGTMFRARFASFEEAQARSVCLALKKKSVECMVVRAP